MKREVPTHWKFDALMQALGVARYEAAGILETLWWWAAEHRDDGRLTGLDARGLSAILGWRGNPDALAAALVSSRWLDDAGDFWIIHDWHEHCPYYVSERMRKRRRRGVKGSHDAVQWLARVELFGWRCRYCSVELTPETLTKDHVIPLSKGGTNWASNLAPACLRCNVKKGVRRGITVVA